MSLILVPNQSQQRAGRQGYIGREVFLGDPFGREILPTDEKVRAVFFHLGDRFQVWIARFKSRLVVRFFKKTFNRRSVKKR